MKKIAILLGIVLLIFSCKKENHNPSEPNSERNSYTMVVKRIEKSIKDTIDVSLKSKSGNYANKWVLAGEHFVVHDGDSVKINYVPDTLKNDVTLRIVKDDGILIEQSNCKCSFRWIKRISI